MENHNITLLRSNIIPSPTEKTHAQKLLEEEKGRLKQYDEGLNRLNEILRRLRKEMDALEARIRKRQSWIVFDVSQSKSYSRSSPESYSQSRMRRSRSPSPLLTLAHVSHYWRKMAVSCPRLWSFISVNVACPRSEFGDILSLYIENSANHPLYINVRGAGRWIGQGDLSKYRERSLGEHGVAILDRILSQSERIRLLKFVLFDLDVGLADTPHRALPLLQRFETNLKIDNMDSWLIKSLKTAPLLNAVSAPFYDRIPPPPLPYCQLTHLTMEPASIK
ncbi:hypothetical protein L218DRAFT_665073 [Marasmius fiardii PR-910]|nr:hypothetical protein L218DRAFT_665073 [Marasmius fiardii PR-910]